VCLLEVGQEA
jgi:hypothetical protein